MSKQVFENYLRRSEPYVLNEALYGNVKSIEDVFKCMIVFNDILIKTLQDNHGDEGPTAKLLSSCKKMKDRIISDGPKIVKAIKKCFTGIKLSVYINVEKRLAPCMTIHFDCNDNDTYEMTNLLKELKVVLPKVFPLYYGGRVGIEFEYDCPDSISMNDINIDDKDFPANTKHYFIVK